MPVPTSAVSTNTLSVAAAKRSQVRPYAVHAGARIQTAKNEKPTTPATARMMYVTVSGSTSRSPRGVGGGRAAEALAHILNHQRDASANREHGEADRPAAAHVAQPVGAQVNA